MRDVRDGVRVSREKIIFLKVLKLVHAPPAASREGWLATGEGGDLIISESLGLTYEDFLRYLPEYLAQYLSY